MFPRSADARIVVAGMAPVGIRPVVFPSAIDEETRVSLITRVRINRVVLSKILDPLTVVAPTAVIRTREIVSPSDADVETRVNLITRVRTNNAMRSKSADTRANIGPIGSERNKNALFAKSKKRPKVE